jgi:hypothetical protein
MIEFAAVIMVFGIPMLAIWTTHKRKMLELQMQLRSQGDTGLRQEVMALREELRALRDTSMQYDLSFDTALQKIDQRMIAVERRVGQIEQTETHQIHLGQ